MTDAAESSGKKRKMVEMTTIEVGGGKDGAYWMETRRDPLSLLSTASAQPWEWEAAIDIDDETQCTTHPVSWKRLPVSTRSSGLWEHEVTWCPRAGNKSVAIHRFRPRVDGIGKGSPRQDIMAALAETQAIAVQEMAASSRKEDKPDAASNVGGFHGERDVFERPAVLRSALPDLVGSAVESAAIAEATELSRAPLITSLDEAWFNVLKPGGWNLLHHHAGSCYSGVLYVSAPPSTSTDSVGTHNLAGRLCLVPYINAPETGIPVDQILHVKHGNNNNGHSAKKFRLPESKDEVIRSSSSCIPGLDKGTKYLVIDPVPGTIIIFPSFLPHFVVPMGGEGLSSGGSSGGGEVSIDNAAAAAQLTKQEDSPLRLSLAFNCGTAAAVLVHLLFNTQEKNHVKIVLETPSVFGLPVAVVDVQSGGAQEHKNPPPFSYRTSTAKQYVEAYDIASRLTNALNRAIQADAVNPAAFMASALLRQDSSMQSEGNVTAVHCPREYLSRHSFVSTLLEDVINTTISNGVTGDSVVEFMAAWLHEHAEKPVITHINVALNNNLTEVEVHTCMGSYRGTAKRNGSDCRGDNDSEVMMSEFSAVAAALVGKNPVDQHAIDTLIANHLKSKGVAGITADAWPLALSIAVCRAGAAACGCSLYEHIASLAGNNAPGPALPVPHYMRGRVGFPGNKSTEEVVICPVQASSFSEALSLATEMEKFRAFTRLNISYSPVIVEQFLRRFNNSSNSNSSVYTTSKAERLAGKLTDKLRLINTFCTISDGLTKVSAARKAGKGIVLLHRVGGAVADRHVSLHMNTTGGNSVCIATTDTNTTAASEPECQSETVEESFMAAFAVGVAAEGILTGAPCKQEQLCQFNNGFMCKFHPFLSLELAMGGKWYAPYRGSPESLKHDED